MIDPQYFEVRRRWPRVLRAVEAYVGNKGLAARYVAKAANNTLYSDIVRVAFSRRHGEKRLKRGTI